jgi:hypothetical protein
MVAPLPKRRFRCSMIDSLSSASGYGILQR